jgi:formamidopyrimidine-DNA glycosylase
VPELPDLTVYVESLQRRIVDHRLLRMRIVSPSVLKTVDPPWREAEGRAVHGVRRLGKRIVVELQGELFLAIHLMKLGRLRWDGAKPGGKILHATLEFDSGTLHLVEIGPKKRASLHVVRGETSLRGLDAGGIEPLQCDQREFATALRRENHTLKRSLTDPRLVAGIGNAYSDEILHSARLSPVALTSRIGDDEIARLFAATREVLQRWTDRLREQTGAGFPDKVTAFRDGMAVHGRFREPCPDCGTAVARIVYADREVNYCPRCQTGGKLLADRALSRLLGEDWPRTVEELEAKTG